MKEITVRVKFDDDAVELAREKQRTGESLGECLLRLWWEQDIRAEDTEVLE